MPLRLYNTLTSRQEPFEPAQPDQTRIYVCGPTVYDYAHLGHARCYIVYDILVRHLRASGQKVLFVRNVTDIDDKIIQRAKERKEDPIALSERFRLAFTDDMRRLGNIDPDVEPKVTDHLDEIRTMIATLIENGSAYESQGDVYFRVGSFPGYGKLSHRKLEDLSVGASGRTATGEAARKENPADFALWKKSPEGEASWPSPWGEGRPGWHIECSAMSHKYLGDNFDLHGGGLDLVFPHHENEIAQSEAATGKPFARHWMHNGFVECNKEKMSKSLGNFFTARELFERIEPEAVRYFMLTVGYRGPLNLDWEINSEGAVTRFPQFEEAEQRVEYLYTTRERLRSIPDARVVDGDTGAVPEEIANVERKLAQALDDDLNLPVSLAVVHDFLRGTNELCDAASAKKGKISRASMEAVERGFSSITERLGLAQQDGPAVLRGIRDRRAKERGLDGAEIERQLQARTDARAAKDFDRADAIRKELLEKGVELLDTPEGTTWRIPSPAPVR
ncbi:MAG: cysteine--tRNA ligase [Myxococcales bacterium]|nr:cysteine--tRNA ligase [Myxococcales bacterium]